MQTLSWSINIKPQQQMGYVLGLITPIASCQPYLGFPRNLTTCPGVQGMGQKLGLAQLCSKLFLSQVRSA